MEFVSILDLEEEEAVRVHMPDSFLDLNIDQLMKLIGDQAPKYEIDQMFYRLPADADVERYRREIYQDVKRQDIFDCLDQFCTGMRLFAKALTNRNDVETNLQKSAWHAAAAYEYCTAVQTLQQALLQLVPASTGLKSLSAFLDAYVQKKDHQELFEAASHIRQQLAAFHLIIEIENNKLTIKEGTLEGQYDAFLGDSAIENISPFAAVRYMSKLEEEVFATFRKKYPALFDEIEKFPKKFAAFGDDKLLRLEQELQYYLAFRRFQLKMEGWNIFLCTPQNHEDQEMYATGLYDLALACANFTQNKPVVSNDFVYHKGERFFVVNGPNQGGKTTFARSLGQLVYFFKMGFDVPAVSANVHTFSDLLTHFSVEESMETGQGKLMEELTRLKPMMKHEKKNAFVIINELFTTAAHYDGCIMGARVLEHFMEAGCTGIYVTHLKELGETVPNVVTMTAMLDGSDQHRRTFKILRHAPEDVGYAEDIVKKYELTYEQLKPRLSEAKDAWSF